MHESAGKRSSGATRKGNPWLRSALVEMAHGGDHSRSYLTAQFRHLAARRGKKRATVALAHSILVIAYHVLRDGTRYRDLGSTYFDERDREAIARRTMRRLEALGFKVTIVEATKVARAPAFSGEPIGPAGARSRTQEGGWSDVRMVERYSHGRPREERRRAPSSLDGLLQGRIRKRSSGAGRIRSIAKAAS